MDSHGEAKAEERRVAPRRRVLKAAQIVFNGGYSLLDCIIENLSLTGARISLSSPALLPEIIAIRFQDGTEQQARIVWKKGNLMGVHFLDAHECGQKAPQMHAGAGGKAPLLARIAEIERQLAELRAEIARSLRD